MLHKTNTIKDQKKELWCMPEFMNHTVQSFVIRTIKCLFFYVRLFIGTDSEVSLWTCPRSNSSQYFYHLVQIISTQAAFILWPSPSTAYPLFLQWGQSKRVCSWFELIFPDYELAFSWRTAILCSCSCCN